MLERYKRYNEAFPKYPPLVATDRWVTGVWMIGNNYQNKMGYYGEYPPTYLKRVMSMFEDIPDGEILHLFSGAVDARGLKYDINPDLESNQVQGDAHNLSEFFPPETFQLILADPPYTEEDALHYGHPMINRNKVVKECAKVLAPGGYLAWLDQVLPMYRKDTFELQLTVGIIRSTNHRFRMLCIFKKV